MLDTENQRLKFIRNQLGMTQEQFGSAFGLKQGSYADVERGKVVKGKAIKISGDIKRILEKEFSINIDWLETGKGHWKIEKPGSFPYEETNNGGRGMLWNEHTADPYSQNTQSAATRVPMYKQLPADDKNISGYLLVHGVGMGSIALKVNDEAGDKTEFGTWVIVGMIK